MHPDIPVIPQPQKQASVFRYFWLIVLLFLVVSVVGVGTYVIDQESNETNAIIESLLTPTPGTLRPKERTTRRRSAKNATVREEAASSSAFASAAAVLTVTP